MRIALKPQPEARRVGPIRRFATTLSSRTTAMLTLLAAMGLGLALRCLFLIGPPPSVRVDSLWVYQNIYHVRILVVAVFVALAASAVAMLSRRRWLPVLSLWAASGAAVMHWFPERTLVIAEQVLLQYLG